MSEKTEAIVLHTLPYRDHDAIITLFSPTRGIVKLYAKRKRGPLLSPLTEGEYLFEQGRGDLARFQDGTIYNQYLAIRDTYETLVTANKLLQAIQNSQLPEKPAPDLYLLLKKCLEALPRLMHPQTLYAAFLLKILKHDGVLQTSATPTACYRYGGECYLRDQAPIGALFFSKEEETTLLQLAHSRQWADFDMPLQREFAEKIDTLFAQI